MVEDRSSRELFGSVFSFSFNFIYCHRNCTYYISRYYVCQTIDAGSKSIWFPNFQSILVFPTLARRHLIDLDFGYIRSISTYKFIIIFLSLVYFTGKKSITVTQNSLWNWALQICLFFLFQLFAQKTRKSKFQPALLVCSTQTLVKIYSLIHSFRKVGRESLLKSILKSIIF